MRVSGSLQVQRKLFFSVILQGKSIVEQEIPALSRRKRIAGKVDSMKQAVVFRRSEPDVGLPVKVERAGIAEPES